MLRPHGSYAPSAFALCTLGATAFGLGVERDQILSIVAAPNVAFRALVAGGVVLCSLGLLFFSLELVNRFARSPLQRFIRQHGYFTVTARVHDLPTLAASYSAFFGTNVPTLARMESWVGRSRDAFQMVYRLKRSENKSQIDLVGSYKMLPLTSKAVDLVRDRKVTGTTLLPQHIAQHSKEVAGVYLGDVFATTRPARAAVLAFIHQACKPAVQKQLPVFARPLTTDGLRVMTNYGFVQVADGFSKPVIGELCELLTFPFLDH